MKNKQMREFKKGDRVWSPMFGFGIVETIALSEDPVLVRFKDQNALFSFSGEGKRYERDIAPTLFHADKIPEYYKQFIKDDRIGKAGYFWDSGNPDTVVYSILKSTNTTGQYIDSRKSTCQWDNFSLTPPELK